MDSASSPDERSPHARNSRAVSPAKRPRVVFVVDDEAIIADMSSTILRAAGFEVHTFYDGAEVMTRPLDVTPDVVVTDFAMPKVNGLKLIAWLREHYPQCKVVMISGHAGMLPDLDHGRRFTLLSKPVPPEELIEVVKKAA